MEYTEMYRKLNFESAFIVFVKKNGDIRVMWATRDVSACSLWYGYLGNELQQHDNRCNINTGAIAVFDMEIGEVRAFRPVSVLYAQFIGQIHTKEQLEHVASTFMAFKRSYQEANPNEVTFEML